MENRSKEYWENEAFRYDVKYEGMQQAPGKPSLPMFTHPCYGTFMVVESETLATAILRKQIQFSSATVKKEKV